MPDSAAVTADAAYSAAFRAAYSGEERIKQLATTAYLLKLYQDQPTLDSDRALEQVLAFQKQYDVEVRRGQTEPYRNTRELLDYVGTAVDITLAMPGIKPVVGSVGRKIWSKWIEGSIEEHFDPINRWTAAKKQYEAASQVHGREDAIVAEALRGARDNPALGRTLDMMYLATLGVSVADGAAAIMDKSPTLKQRLPEKVRRSVAPNGTVTVDRAALEAMVKEQYDALTKAAHEQLDYLKQIDAQQQDILAWMKDETLRRTKEAEAEARAAQLQGILDGASSTIYLLSTFVGLADPKAGRQIAGVGNAAIQLVQAYSSYTKTAAALADLGALGSALSGAVLTGNVVGVAMSLVSLFAQQGPSPEQMILDQVQQLREQVARLREEMHDRFDRIDRTLNLILQTLDKRFDDLATRLDTIYQRVDEIQQELLQVQADLDRLAANTWEYLQAAGQRPLREAITGALGYRQRTGTDMPYERYVEYENVFFAWATEHARDALEVGAARSFDDDRLADELDGPLGANLLYIHQWLERRGLPGLNAGRLANPVTWSIAAAGYAQLELEWPEHARRIDPARRVAVQQVGRDLQAALRALVFDDAAGVRAANRPLFDGLFAHYDACSAGLDRALQAVHDTYRNDQPLPPGVDLAGTVDQAPSYAPAGLGKLQPPADGSRALSALDAPGGLQSFVPAPFLLADYFGVDSGGAAGKALTATYDIVLTDLVSDRRGTPNLVIVVRYQGEPVVGRAFRGRTLIAPPRTGISVYDLLDGWLSSNWESRENIRARFPQESVDWPLPVDQQVRLNALRNRLVPAVDARLADHRKRLYGETAQAIQGGTARSAARAVTGAKALLSSVVNLGLPRGLERDDLLRALLDGSQSLVDDGRVAVRYAEEATVTGRPALATLRKDILDDAARRRDALKTVLEAHLTGLQEGRLSEDQPGVRRVLVTAEVAGKLTAFPRYDDGELVLIGVPDRMVAGERYPINVTARNTGEATWEGGARPVRLADRAGTGAPGVWRADLPVAAVEPGQEVTFQLEVTAPLTAGQHALRWQLVREGDGMSWFGLPVVATVEVDAGGENGQVPVAEAGLLRAVRGAISRGEPSRAGAILARLTPDQEYPTDGYTEQGQAINGSPTWYHLTADVGGGWVHASGGAYRRR